MCTAFIGCRPDSFRTWRLVYEFNSSATSSRLLLFCHIARHSSSSLHSHCDFSLYHHFLIAVFIVLFGIASGCKELQPVSMITTVLSTTPKLHKLLSLSWKPFCAAITCLYKAIFKQASRSTFRPCMYLSNGVAYSASHANHSRLGSPH